MGSDVAVTYTGIGILRPLKTKREFIHTFPEPIVQPSSSKLNQINYFFRQRYDIAPTLKNEALQL